MNYTRQAVLAAVSLSALLAVVPLGARADDKPPANNQSSDQDKNKKHGDHQERAKENREERRDEKRGSFGKPQTGQNFQNKASGQSDQNGGDNSGAKFNKKFQNPDSGRKEFGKGPPSGEPKNFDKQTPALTTLPPNTKLPADNGSTKKVPPATFTKDASPDDRFRAEDKQDDKNKQRKHFGNHDKDQGAPGTLGTGGKPVVVNPALLNKTPSGDQPKWPPKALSADDSRKRFDDLRNARKEKVEAGGKVFIEEPGNRTIIRDKDRLVIQHDDTERLRRVAPNARFEKGAGGVTVSIIDRPGNARIYSETDASGQLLRRYRRDADGRETIIIDNRRRHHGGFGKDVAVGAGIGIGIVAGAAILNSFIDVPEPRIVIPREKYIVDYDRASDEDVYEALIAPPVDDLADRYTLDEIRATVRLRDRMRRIDLDDITFDFGSWEVDPGQYDKLERIARAMLRVIRHNPNEVFLIEGYTDAVGSREDNLSLSDRRAESVAEVLTEQFQVPFENLTTQGYGEDFLKVPTDGPDRLNRRVAVRRITPLLARDEARRSDREPYDDRGGPAPGDRGPDDRNYAGPPADDRGPGSNGQPYDYGPYRSPPPTDR